VFTITLPPAALMLQSGTHFHLTFVTLLLLNVTSAAALVVYVSAQRSSPHAPRVLPSATEPFRRLLHLFGTVCRRQYVHRRHYQFSAEYWRLNFLSGLTAVLPHERLTVLSTDYYVTLHYCYVSLQS